MSPAGKSVTWFGYYLVLTGLTLAATPNLLLGMFGIEPASEVWIRVVGALAFSIGIYYAQMGKEDNRTFFALTVYIRGSVLLWFAAFVLLGWAPWQLILFGVIDALGAVWTYSALKS